MTSDLSHSRPFALSLGDEDYTPRLGEPFQIVGKVMDKEFQRTRPLQRIQPTTTPKVSQTTTQPYTWEIGWSNVFGAFLVHIVAFIVLYQTLVLAKWKTLLWCYFLIVSSCIGITAGTHRLWSHRAYKAKLPLRLLLAFLQTVALQSYIYRWVRIHRVHHKFTDTDADPHNAKRGFFFAHMGWVFIKKHKDVSAKGKTIDIVAYRFTR